MKKRDTIICILALALLAAVLVFVNLKAKPGDTLEDFTVVCTDGSTFRLSEQRGKTVVLNVWAPWCTPCLHELPDFEKYYKESNGGVVMLALNADPAYGSSAQFKADNGYTLPFADITDAGLARALNPSSVLPQTVVIAPDGTVTYHQAGAISYERLKTLVDKANG